MRLGSLLAGFVLLCSPVLEAQQRSSTSALDQTVDRIVAREADLVKELEKYSPLVETYIQNLTGDPELGHVPTTDRYFLNKVNFKGGTMDLRSFHEDDSPFWFFRVLRAVTRMTSLKFYPAGFARVVVDPSSFNRSNYEFEFIRREFLGEVRCLVFDVRPFTKNARFSGRIWVEDRDLNIVRFNGAHAPDNRFHFDSWRQQIGPGLWLPTFVYSEESNLPYRSGLFQRSISYKSQTRIWGYNLTNAGRSEEFTSITVDSPDVKDGGGAIGDASPVESLRAWERLAEDNVLDRMERIGILAPPGSVDTVLRTVVNNLEITNNLEIEPPVRVRVLLTSPLEAFNVGHSIVVSKGLIDVLPDEASLAMILARQLAHIALGHRLDTKYAFNDRMQFSDEQLFGMMEARRTEKEEEDADTRAMELLNASPYKDKLVNAGLFLKAVNDRGARLPNLLTPQLGNFFVVKGAVVRMAGLMNQAPELLPAKKEQVSALPLGSRTRVDPWNASIRMTQSEPMALLSAREKMPFEVTPVLIHLTRTPAVSSTRQQP